MFIGHFAPAMVAAAHKDAPPLPVLMIGGQLVDWGFFALLLTGAEKMRVTPGITAMNPMDLYHMPYTHSLVGSIAWGAAFGIIINLMTKRRWAGVLGFAVVVSHWFLDVLVHTHDMTLAGNPPKLGFGLWNYPAIEMPLEIALTFGALWYFARKTGAAQGPVLILAVILALLQGVNWFGAQPTEVNAGSSLLAFFAYGLATLASWWVWKKSSANSLSIGS